MTRIISANVAALFLCAFAVATGVPALAQGQPPGTEETPALGQTSYELKSKTPAGIVTEYVSPTGIRREFGSGGSISIWDFRTGETHFLNSLTHKDMMQQGKPLVGKPRYYDSMRWLKKVGNCSYLGESGNL